MPYKSTERGILELQASMFQRKIETHQNAPQTTSRSGRSARVSQATGTASYKSVTPTTRSSHGGIEGAVFQIISRELLGCCAGICLLAQVEIKSIFK